MILMYYQEVTSTNGKIQFYVPLDREKIAEDVKKLSIRATAGNFTTGNNNNNRLKMPVK